MEIQFLKAHHRFAYFEGEVANLPDEVAADLLKSGHAKTVETADKAGKKPTEPKKK